MSEVNIFENIAIQYPFKNNTSTYWLEAWIPYTYWLEAWIPAHIGWKPGYHTHIGWKPG